MSVMDGQVVEDDAYSDDDLDALPANDFHELQEDAFKFTQQHKESITQGMSRNAQLAPSELAEGFGRLPGSADGAAHYKGLQESSSDYGDLNDELLDGEIFNGAEHLTANEHVRSAVLSGESTQREQWRQKRYGRPPEVITPYNSIPVARQPNGYPLSKSKVTSASNAGTSLRTLPSVDQALPEASNELSLLQAQVQTLLHDREALRRAVQQANDSAFAKSGEIAIVRAKISRAEQELESRTKAQQRLHAEESAKYRVAIEKARAEIQSITTEKAFLENELGEGNKQLRQVQKTIKSRATISGATKGSKSENPLATPTKTMKSRYADGFDDDEVEILSPSKLALRGKSGTPKAGVKRKRKPLDGSPTRPQPLPVVEPARDESHEEPERQQLISEPAASNERQKLLHTDFRFIQMLLNHRVEPGQARTIEALTQFRLPARPDKTLSTLLYDDILVLGGGPKADNLPAAVGLIVVSLWSQCMKEGYHDPIHLLINLVEFMIVVTPLKIAPELTNSLMGLVQETADIIVIPRCQKKPPHQDSFGITSTACLRVMEIMAQDCAVDTQEITRFWRTMRFDFTMMLLSFLHPIEELHITIALLRTSILNHSFAMIIPPGDGKQDASEAHVIDNLSRLLVESPRPAQGEAFLDAVQLSELRLEILELLRSMCERKYSAEALVRHRLVIGRLVRVMNDELDRAYDFQYGHAQRIALVNAATHLLHFLTSNYASLIDMQARLSVIPGGEKKFLIALTRLAFSEGSLLEAGIADEVVEKAHQMLEIRISPEEADQLVGAFASAQSTRRGSKESN